MQLKLEAVEKIGPGVWTTKLKPSDVRRFGEAAPTFGSRSIVGVTSANFDSTTSSMLVELDNLSAIAVGFSDESIVIDLDHNTNDQTESRKPSEAIAPEGDRDFIGACKTHLSEQMVSIIAEVLSEVRISHKDRLVEGVGRKWTTSPSNFLAITIQNQKKQFLVSVRADPSRQTFKHIRLKRSRAPYCEFHLNSQSQISEAIQAILTSALY